MNTDAPWPSLDEATVRVLGIQAKLHQWATDSPNRRFDDLFNLVADPAFLVVAWDRVRGNRGARSAGVDGVAPRSIALGTKAFLPGLRDDLKARRFEPLPVRQRMIPKASGKLRSLGIPTARDRVVQASLKLVLEPIFEAGFHPCSYGFRPRRRPHDAIAEIHILASNEYTWVLEGDIKACFDEIDHPALMDRVRARVGDKRVLALVKSFLRAGVLSEDGVTRDTKMGTPQGGILSPLANIALSVLDDHFVEAWQDNMATRVDRARHRRHGHATYRLVRYADDFVVMVSGTKAHAEGLRDEVAAVLRPMGLRLSEEKTMTVHIEGVRLPRLSHPAPGQAGVEQAIRLHLAFEEGTVFHQGQGGDDHQAGHQPPALHPPAPPQHGAARVDQLLPTRRVQGHLRLPPPVHLAAGGAMAAPQAPPCQLEVAATALPGQQVVARARRRGAVRLSSSAGDPLPLSRGGDPHAMERADDDGGRVVERHGLVESRMRWKSHVRFGGRAGETDQS